MDYSKLIEDSQTSDLAYAKWYSALPDERKAKMFLDGYNFVAEKVRYDILQENPMATKAEVMLRFIELNHREDYDAETWEFVRAVMEKKIEEEWKARFKKMKKALGWSYEEIAKFIGASSDNAVKASVSRKLPAFAKLAVCVFEQLQLKQ